MAKTRRRKTDGERIADRIWSGRHNAPNGALVKDSVVSDIDRIIRKRMAEAWSHGYFSELSSSNPYHGRKKKEDGR